MSLLYQNVRGLRTKLSNLYVESFNINHQVLVFTETWLNNNFLSTEILCNKFNIFRRDRETYGGGVLIAVANSLYAERVNIDSFVDIEFIAVVIKLKHKRFLVTCSYIPPSSPQSLYIQHAEAIKHIAQFSNELDTLIVMGDFNLPSLSWKFVPEDKYYVPIKLSDSSKDFINMLQDMGLFQINGVINDFSKILDLILVTDKDDCNVNRTIPVTTPEDRFHPAIELIINLPLEHNYILPTIHEKVFAFKQTNYNALNELIVNVDWNSILAFPSEKNTQIDHIFKVLYNKLFNFMDLCIPKYRMKSESGPPWNNGQLSRAKNNKNKCYKKFKRSGSSVDYSRYAVSRAEYTRTNKLCYALYLNKIQNNIKYDPKSFYNFINSKKRTTGYPTVMKFNQNESCDATCISDLFADFFSTTYSDATYDKNGNYPFPIAENPAISISFFDTQTVANGLKKLKFSYKYGPDKIPSNILIMCAEALSIPLTILFNTSIKFGYFPKIWKESFIVPLFKSGTRSDIKNYRGIAKLSIIPKFFEKLITENLYYQISNIISPYQHGFKKGCSTTTNLLQLTIAINRGFFAGNQTDVIYTDFSKAFDKVNHALLVKKLQIMGFTDLTLKWIYSYLSNRVQTVLFNKTFSRKINVPSGVPQGSHLGPALFLLFINDLPGVIKFSNVLMYADDVKIFLTYNHVLDHQRLQDDLSCFYEWCKANLMELNLKKCKLMRFSRNNPAIVYYFLGGIQVDAVENFLDLGILLDPKLSFNSHITFMINKARGTLGYIKRWAREFDDPYITKTLYMALVRPILEYGSIIWDPIYQTYSNLIESVQKQFLLFCLRGLHFNPLMLPSYTSRLALIKLPTLKSRRTMLNVSFILNIINGDICAGFLINEISFNIPQRPSRNFIPLSIKFFRANYGDADPLRRMCNTFNQLYRFIDYSLDPKLISRLIIAFLN